MDRSAYASMSAQEQDHWWFLARRAIIDSLVRTHVPLPSDAHILEAGCGTGGNLALLAQYGALDAMEYDAEARIGTPDRLDHLNLLEVSRIAPDDGTISGRVGDKGRCFRVHSENIKGTNCKGKRSQKGGAMCNDYRLEVDIASIAEDFEYLKIRIRMPEGKPNVPSREDIRITDIAPIVRSIEGERGSGELVNR